jgi:hypothetical protein
MIKGREATTPEEILTVLKVMKKENHKGFFSPIYGFWKDDVCLGGAFLDNEFPPGFVFALTNANTFSLGKAMADILREFLKLQTSIISRISEDNYKSLKINKAMGCKEIYRLDGMVFTEFRKEYWKYQDKWPI